MPRYDNNGRPEIRANEITRLCFGGGRQGEHTHRLLAYARIIEIGGDGAYRHCYDMPPWGEGRRSHLYKSCQLVAYLYEEDKRDGSGFSAAQVFADYVPEYLELLRAADRGEGAADAPAPAGEPLKYSLLQKCVSDANFLKRGRPLDQMAAGDLEEYARLMLKAAALARELATLAGDVRRVVMNRFPGAGLGATG